MLKKVLSRGKNLAYSLNRSYSQLQKPAQKDFIKKEYLQFNKSQLNFGELPFGAIPQALKYNRASSFKQLENGVKICCETWNSALSSITISIKAGPRNQTFQTSGVSALIVELAKQGSINISPQQLLHQISAINGSISTRLNRENLFFTITYQSGKDEAAMNILYELVFNSTKDQAALQASKQSIVKRSNSLQDPYKLCLQNAYFTSYRDHYFSQPENGVRQIVPSITFDHIQDFKGKNFVGTNITVSGAGKLDQNILVKLSSKLQSLPSYPTAAILNPNRPLFTPSSMFIRDDELHNACFAVSFQAPSMNHPDWFGMQLVKQIMGKFRIDRDNVANLNSNKLDYSSMHSYLGSMPDIVRQDCFYHAYSDTGLLGNFLMGNEVFNMQMLFGSQYILTSFGSQSPQVQIFRGRAKVWNKLLNRNNSRKVSFENAVQATYWGRLCSRTQIATKVSYIDPQEFKRLVSRWFYDKEISVVAWGPLHNVIKYHSYNKLYKRSTLGKYGTYPTMLNL